MKKLLFILTASLLVLSCSDDDNSGEIVTDSSEVVLLHTANAVTYTSFSSTEPWSISLSDTKRAPSWLWVSPMSGEAGETELTIGTTEANTTDEDRNAFIVIKGGGATKKIAVTQKKEQILLLSENLKMVSFKASTIDVELKANIEYDMRMPSSATWLSQELTRSVNTHNLKFSVTENTTDKERTAKIYFTDKASQIIKILTIQQFPKIKGSIYNVEVMGTLGDLLDYSATKRDTITYMKIRGEIDDQDFKVLNSLPNLSVLDLREVTANNNVIPDGAFNRPISEEDMLTKVYLPTNLTTIGEMAFYRRSSLSGSLVIPDGVTSIGNYAFWGCTGFTGSLTLPEGLTTIGNHAFQRCSGFTGNLTIPSTVTSIGLRAFSDCKGFTGSLVLPSSVTKIADSAFQRCTGFTGNLVIPNSVTFIGFQAFAGCTGFTGTVTLPDNITRLGYGIFASTKIDAIKLSWATPIAPPGSDGGIVGDLGNTGIPILIPSASAQLYREKWLGHGIDFNFVEY